MSSLPADISLPVVADSIPDAQSRVQRDYRDLIELAVGYALIMLAIWSPRPWQRSCDWLALVWVLAVTVIGFDGFTENGLREKGLLRSFWVVETALLLAGVAIVIAARLDTLRLPSTPMAFVGRYWAYAIWAILQEFLLLDFFLRRLQRVLRSTAMAIIATAVLFATAHLPNPILTPITLVWGAIACLLFLRYRNIYTLGIAHAIFGICIAITVPGQIDHNMRVGLGYLTYRGHHHRHHQNHIPQMVSTQACVMDEAPTRRS